MVKIEYYESLTADQLGEASIFYSQKRKLSAFLVPDSAELSSPSTSTPPNTANTNPNYANISTNQQQHHRVVSQLNHHYERGSDESIDLSGLVETVSPQNMRPTGYPKPVLRRRITTNKSRF